MKVKSVGLVDPGIHNDLQWIPVHDTHPRDHDLVQRSWRCRTAACPGAERAATRAADPLTCYLCAQPMQPATVAFEFEPIVGEWSCPASGCGWRGRGTYRPPCYLCGGPTTSASGIGEAVDLIQRKIATACALPAEFLQAPADRSTGPYCFHNGPCGPCVRNCVLCKQEQSPY